MESITTYKNQHGQRRSGKKFMAFKLCVNFAAMQKILDCLILKNIKHYTGTQDQSDTPVSANDMCALEEWPSHARRNRAQLQDGTCFSLYLCHHFLQSNTQ